MKPAQKIIARCDRCGYERCHKCGRASLHIEIVRDRSMSRLEWLFITAVVLAALLLFHHQPGRPSLYEALINYLSRP